MTDNEFDMLLALLEEHTRVVLGATEHIAPPQHIRAVSNSDAYRATGANHEESAALHNLQSAICNCTRGPRG